ADYAESRRHQRARNEKGGKPMKARKPRKESPPENEKSELEASERFVHLGSGCFLDRKTGNVIVL
ncbi:MAG TPA: hypothetical protein VJ921_11710, partial [Vicinamibacteria bacterium]|nr:hypothetical protein [Vicinamibacteria bacterium]